MPATGLWACRPMTTVVGLFVYVSILCGAISLAIVLSGWRRPRKEWPGWTDPDPVATKTAEERMREAQE